MDCDSLLRVKTNCEYQSCARREKKKIMISFDDQYNSLRPLSALEPFGRFDNDINFNLRMDMGYPFWAIMMFCM